MVAKRYNFYALANETAGPNAAAKMGADNGPNFAPTGRIHKLGGRIPGKRPIQTFAHHIR